MSTRENLTSYSRLIILGLCFLIASSLALPLLGIRPIFAITIGIAGGCGLTAYGCFATLREFMKSGASYKSNPYDLEFRKSAPWFYWLNFLAPAITLLLTAGLSIIAVTFLILFMRNN